MPDMWNPQPPKGIDFTLTVTGAGADLDPEPTREAIQEALAAVLAPADPGGFTVSVEHDQVWPAVWALGPPDGQPAWRCGRCGSADLTHCEGDQSERPVLQDDSTADALALGYPTTSPYSGGEHEHLECRYCLARLRAPETVEVNY